MQDKQTKLDQIAAEIVKNNVCPDLAKSAKHLVPGEGNPDAAVMFIGEAPGKNEDLTGKPFVGSAGKFLDELLLSIGLKREDVFITSILKYRPPNNRDPRPAEKEAFWPYLLAQVEVINPTLIVALGRHGANCFLPDLRIGQEHGQPQSIRLPIHRAVGRSDASAMQGAREERTEAYKKGTLEEHRSGQRSQRAASHGRVGGSAAEQDMTVWTILPLYHPAAALYNGSMRQTLFDDFKVITELLHLRSKSVQHRGAPGDVQ